MVLPFTDPFRMYLGFIPWFIISEMKALMRQGLHVDIVSIDCEIATVPDMNTEVHYKIGLPSLTTTIQ